MKDNNVVPTVIVIGLDGADWNILYQLIEEGKLPFFKKMLNEGSYGYLESIKPPVSVPAWKCYSTGRDPSDLGVYTFIKVDLKARKYKVVQSHDFRGKDIWDYLGMYGYFSCVYKMFSTHPVRRINGCIISELPLNEKGYSPRTLKQEIEEKFDSLWVDTEFTTDREKTYYKVLKLTKKDFEVMKYLIKKYKPNFVHLTVYHTDTIQHFFWKELTEKDPVYGTFIENAWIKVTEYIEDFVKTLKVIYGEHFYLFLISDHGFTNVKYRFNMYQWLLEKKYITIKPISKLYNLILNFVSLDIFYDIIEFLTKLFGMLKINCIKKMGLQYKIASVALEKGIDFGRSRIIPLEGRILYVNRAYYRTKKERDLFVSKIMNELNQIKAPDGTKLIKEIIDGHEYYGTDKAPDILIIPNSVDINNSILVKDLWSKPLKNTWTGMHDSFGILIAKGPYIKKKYKITHAKIIDIAPTILHIFGLPIPKSMRGRVIKEIFEDYVPKELITQQQKRLTEVLSVRRTVKSLKQMGKI